MQISLSVLKPVKKPIFLFQAFTKELNLVADRVLQEYLPKMDLRPGMSLFCRLIHFWLEEKLEIIIFASTNMSGFLL